jgi:pullulanase/glycogen debranching enzyme
MEYHVDGFCFVNASALTKGPHGEELSRPLLVEEITFDPILSSCKLFADLSSPFTSVGKVFSNTFCRNYSHIV